MLSKNDPKIITRDETRAINILETITTSKNKHYEIGLLQETDNPKLPINRELAEKSYKEIINQYISKGYARKLTQKEIRNTSDIINFIPHHCVLNPKKPDKVRAVFNQQYSIMRLSRQFQACLFLQEKILPAQKHSRAKTNQQNKIKQTLKKKGNFFTLKTFS